MPPLPPNKLALQPKRAKVSIIEMGGQKGSFNFSFALSNIAILDRIKYEMKSPLPESMINSC